MKRLTPLSISVALLIVLFTCGLAAAGTDSGEVGTPAPDWTLQEYMGGTHTLSDYSGKVVFMFVVGNG